MFNINLISFKLLIVIIVYCCNKHKIVCKINDCFFDVLTELQYAKAMQGQCIIGS